MELDEEEKEEEENMYYENSVSWSLYQIVKIHIDNLMKFQVKQS